MSLVMEAHNHAREVRNRLRNPSNAVKDEGIDLKRKPKPMFHVELQTPIEAPQPKAQWALGPIMEYALSYVRPAATVRDIQRMVARQFEINLPDIISGRRTTRLVRPRHIAMYLCRKFTTQSTTRIGKLFGDRDHATVIHAVSKITAERETDSALDSMLTMFEADLKPAA